MKRNDLLDSPKKSRYPSEYVNINFKKSIHLKPKHPHFFFFLWGSSTRCCGAVPKRFNETDGRGFGDLTGGGVDVIGVEGDEEAEGGSLMVNLDLEGFKTGSKGDRAIVEAMRGSDVDVDDARDTDCEEG